MDVLGAGQMNPATRELDRSAEAELAELRAQVAWLKAEREELWWAVCHDELTGLPNRRLFSALAPSEMHPGVPAAVILLDLNGFKPINDGFGHETGDRVLRVVAQRLVSCIHGGVVARLGGDEFAGVLTGRVFESSTHWWQPAVAELSAAIARSMTVAGHTLSVTASIGVALASDSVPISELLHRADMAMYQAKTRRGQYVAWAADGAGTGPAPQPTFQHEPPHRPQSLDSRHLAAGEPASDYFDAPTGDPDQRDPAEVAPASTYRRADPVWVHRQGAWRPGIVEAASARAVMVTYRRTQGTGTVVDTMSADCVLARATFDAHLDGIVSLRDTAA